MTSEVTLPAITLAGEVNHIINLFSAVSNYWSFQHLYGAKEMTSGLCSHLRVILFHFLYSVLQNDSPTDSL